MRIFGFRPLGPFRTHRRASRTDIRILFGPEPEALGYEAADAAAVKGRIDGEPSGRPRRSDSDIEKIVRSGA